MRGVTSQYARVRAASQDDESALRALDAAAWTVAATFPSVLAAQDSMEFFGASHPPDVHLVAELDGAVAGYVRLTPPTSLPENGHVLQISGIAVAPAARGRGVAQVLLSAAEQRARDVGAGKLSLRVLATNAPARTLYERCGFVVEGVLRAEFRIDGVDVDDVLMARYLNGA